MKILRKICHRSENNKPTKKTHFVTGERVTLLTLGESPSLGRDSGAVSSPIWVECKLSAPQRDFSPGDYSEYLDEGYFQTISMVEAYSKTKGWVGTEGAQYLGGPGTSGWVIEMRSS